MIVFRCLLVATVALTTSAAFAGVVSEIKYGVPFDVGPDEDVSFAPNDDNRIGVRFQNLSGTTGQLTINFKQGPALLSDQKVSGGFQLLDGTLKVTSDIPDGKKRVRYRMGYRRRDVRRLGLRARTVRVMRLRERAKRWVPAQLRMNDERIKVRYLRERSADFTLGHYGFTGEEQYAWAVLDVTSSYALGALPVPEPASWLMVLSGGGLLLSRLFRRRRRT